MKLYIAYGSNLNLRQMSYRCAGAKVLYTGIVKNYALVYRGSKTGAYATLIHKKGEYTPVAVWMINEEHEQNLDIYEGYPNFYYKKQLWVALDDGRNVRAMAYIMFDTAKVGKPSDSYIAVCRQGYIDNGLDTLKLEESLKKNLEELEEANQIAKYYNRLGGNT